MTGDAMPAPSRIAKVVIAGQDFVPASALDKLHAENREVNGLLRDARAEVERLRERRDMLVELVNAVDSHCDVDHGTSGCPLALVDRIRGALT